MAESSTAAVAKLVTKPASIPPIIAEGPGIPGIIVHREFLGSAVRYGVMAAGSEIVVEVPFSSRDGLEEVGSLACIAIDINQAQLLDA